MKQIIKLTESELNDLITESVYLTLNEEKNEEVDEIINPIRAVKTAAGAIKGGIQGYKNGGIGGALAGAVKGGFKNSTIGKVANVAGKVVNGVKALKGNNQQANQQANNQQANNGGGFGGNIMGAIQNLIKSPNITQLLTNTVLQNLGQNAQTATNEQIERLCENALVDMAKDYIINESINRTIKNYLR